MAMVSWLNFAIFLIVLIVFATFLIVFVILAILVYRVLRNERKKLLKLIHAGLNGTALVFALFAIWAVIHFHNAKGIPNYYSLHSWIGAMTLTMFSLQYAFGFVSFLFPGIPLNYRTLIMPYHVFLGVTIFIMACATALIGITEKAFFSL